MRIVIFLLLFTVCLYSCSRKPYQKEMIREALVEFKNIDSICGESNAKQFLNFQLCAPVLLFDPETRHVFGNEPGDSLENINGVYAGILPTSITAINGPLNWNGKQWNLLILPLPENKNHLIIQTLLKYHESKLGINQLQSPYCQHLNERNNRIWMKIEATALEMALSTDDESTKNEHLRMALAARKMRKIYTGDYFIREQHHDLKTGFPELIWLLMNQQNPEENKAALAASLSHLQETDHLMNAFADVMFPAYGYLMSQQSTQWLKSINHQTDLISLVQDFYQFSYPEDFGGVMNLLSTKYNRQSIEDSEDQRELRLKALAEKYHQKFIGVPFVMIRLNKQTSIEYLSDQMIPFDGKGYIVPEIRVTGSWGTITVSDGALINNENSYLYFSAPFNISGNKIKGADWQLELNPGYGIQPYPGTDKYIVNRNPL
jgi:hypothetical protein